MGSGRQRRWMAGLGAAHVCAREANSVKLRARVSKQWICWIGGSDHPNVSPLQLVHMLVISSKVQLGSIHIHNNQCGHWGLRSNCGGHHKSENTEHCSGSGECVTIFWWLYLMTDNIHHSTPRPRPGPGPTLELETRVHPKVRNHGEGPYYGLLHFYI